VPLQEQQQQWEALRQVLLDDLVDCKYHLVVSSQNFGVFASPASASSMKAAWLVHSIHTLRAKHPTLKVNCERCRILPHFRNRHVDNIRRGCPYQPPLVWWWCSLFGLQHIYVYTAACSVTPATVWIMRPVNTGCFHRQAAVGDRQCAGPQGGAVQECVSIAGQHRPAQASSGCWAAAVTRSLQVRLYHLQDCQY
jgi:hypothetical protein